MNARVWFRRAICAVVVGVFSLVAGGISAGWAQEPGQLRVKVLDQTGGTLPHATISLKGDGATSATLSPSDTAGVFAVSALPPGRYTLTVDAEGFRTATKTVDVR